MTRIVDLLRRKPAPPVRDVAAAAAAAGLARPAIHAIAQGAPSRSHFGGAPRLPDGIAWPARQGRPLDFLARLSLAELQAAHSIDWLPADGALLFFYDAREQPWGFDPADRDGFAVLHAPDLPVATAPGVARDGAIAPRPLGFRSVETWPSYERDEVHALGLTDAETDAYIELCGSGFGDLPRHQVGGFPAPVQADAMERECQLGRFGNETGSDAWRLLFQIDADDDLGVMWGDCGTLYFWVTEEAARAGDFSGAWAVLQCC